MQVLTDIPMNSIQGGCDKNLALFAPASCYVSGLEHIYRLFKNMRLQLPPSLIRD
jgi:hypothetical protein